MEKIIDKEFCLQRAKDALDAWKNYNVSEELLDKLLSVSYYKNYKEFIDLADKNVEVRRIKDILFKLIAYCDSKAANKNELNEYEDKKVVAMCGIRQNAFIAQFLKYKKEATSVTKSISNIVSYLESPERRMPIVSEKHRKSISSYYLKKVYDSSTFDEDMIKLFSNTKGFASITADSSYSFTREIYAEKSRWINLNDSHQRYFIAIISNDKYFYQAVTQNMWLTQHRYEYQPTSNVTKILNVIKTIKPGDVLLLINNNRLYAYGEAIEYEDTSSKVSNISKIIKDEKCEFDSGVVSYQDSSVFYEDLSEGVNSWGQRINVAKWESYSSEGLDIRIDEGKYNKNISNYIFEINEQFAKEKMDELDKQLVPKVTDLLKSNHNLILTGAPGTGKTYLAKEIVKVMGAEYEMVQFHPSYDYSDFVEGLRPVKEGGTKEIGFELVDGVFKAFCRRAVLSRLHGGDSFDKVYNSLIDDIKSGKISSYKTKTGIQQKLSINNNGQILYECKSPRTEKVDNLRLMFDYFVSNEIYDLSEYSKDTYCDIISQLTSGVTKTIDYVEYGWTLQEILNRFKDGGFNQPKMENKSKPFVFIIDEINRGEISKIFGELFYSIDPGYRVPFNTVPTKDEMIKTQYDNLVDKSSDNPFSEGFYVPDNVYIIGTMNDIDRSVESMDFAMRRRFAWKEIKAAENVGMLDELGDNKDKVIEVMNRLNNTIWNENDNTGIEGLSSSYHIGAAYFLKLGTYLQESDDDIDIAFRQLWFNHLKGLLYEYLRGYSNIAESMKILEKAYFGE